MRTARTLGFRPVALFSDANADALHLQQAAGAVHIGPAAAAESYLSIPGLLAAARATGANKVHPGCGFLSDSADFALASTDAGLVFIGAQASAIDAMGHMADAKRRMQAAGAPCALGCGGKSQDEATLTDEPLALAFPLRVKAVAGGGGRGVRQVQRAEELAAALAGARREPQKGVRTETPLAMAR